MSGDGFHRPAPLTTVVSNRVERKVAPAPSDAVAVLESVCRNAVWRVRAEMRTRREAREGAIRPVMCGSLAARRCDSDVRGRARSLDREALLRGGDAMSV